MTAEERTLSLLCRNILQVSDLSLDSSFFAQGGDSLTAVELVEAIQITMGRVITVQDVYDADTIRDLLVTWRR